MDELSDEEFQEKSQFRIAIIMLLIFFGLIGYLISLQIG